MKITEDKSRAYEYALYLLDYRDYSYIAMFDRLMETYNDEEVCYAATDRLAEYGMINDRRYAELLAEKYIMRKKYGVDRAKREMYEKGLRGEILSESLEPYKEAEEENLDTLLETKYSRYLTDKNDRRSIDKVRNALVRHGYGFNLISRGLRRYFENQEL